MKYEKLDERIASTYGKYTGNNAKRSLYDSYIRAFRWASDRIKNNGVIGFITNGAYIDNIAMSGFRKRLLEEFSSVYVFNLRGNQRTSGEQSRREGGKIFGGGSRSPIAITCLVKNTERASDKYIHYCDIGDYLSREEKLHIIAADRDITGVKWNHIVPDENNDWINKKSAQFDNFLMSSPIRKDDEHTKSIFITNSNGVVTNRDYWAYNFSKQKLAENISNTIDFFNRESERISGLKKNNPRIKAKDEIKKDETKIKWVQNNIKDIDAGKIHSFIKEDIRSALYRPFQEEYLYFNKSFNWSRYLMPKYFPASSCDNLCICVTGIGASKPFSCIMTNLIPNLHTVDTGQCFPLYEYHEKSSLIYLKAKNMKKQ